MIPVPLQSCMSVGDWAPEALRLVLPWGLAAIGAVLLVGVVVAAWRATTSRAQLKHRVAVTLLPTESFDPSLAAVVRFSAQLARVRPAVAFVPRRASALRLSVRTGADGRVVHQVSGPARAASVLRSAAYPQVEMLAADADDTVPSLSVQAPADVADDVVGGGGRAA